MGGGGLECTTMPGFIFFGKWMLYEADIDTQVTGLKITVFCLLTPYFCC
jgi:hypothetical protein